MSPIEVGSVLMAACVIDTETSTWYHDIKMIVAQISTSICNLNNHLFTFKLAMIWTTRWWWQELKFVAFTTRFVGSNKSVHDTISCEWSIIGTCIRVSMWKVSTTFTAAIRRIRMLDGSAILFAGFYGMGAMYIVVPCTRWFGAVKVSCGLCKLPVATITMMMIATWWTTILGTAFNVAFWAIVCSTGIRICPTAAALPGVIILRWVVFRKCFVHNGL